MVSQATKTTFVFFLSFLFAFIFFKVCKIPASCMPVEGPTKIPSRISAKLISKAGFSAIGNSKSATFFHGRPSFLTASSPRGPGISEPLLIEVAITNKPGIFFFR